MSSNKSVKEAMIKKYGADCFIEKLKLRDTSGLRYRSKAQYKRMKQLTYHHIKKRSENGKTTIENGALLSAENHQWFHRQTPQKQAKMNQMFQDYKKTYEDCQVVIASEIPQIAEIRIADFNVREFCRAKEKRETQKLIDEYYEGEYK